MKRSGGRRLKNIKKVVAAALITVFSLSAVGCNMISKTPEAKKKSTVVKINGEKVTREAFDQKMDSVIQQLKTQFGPDFDKSEQGKEIIEAQKKQILESIETEVLMKQKAKELKLYQDEKKLNDETNKKFDEIKKAYNDDKKFQDALKAAGFTEASLKEYLKNQIITNAVIEYVVKNVKVDDKKVQDYYEAHKNEYTEKPNRIHLAHIIVSDEAQAKEIKAKLNKGEDFAKLAKQYGTDGTKDKGGDLGFIEYNDPNYDATFMKAALALKVGTISEPVKTSFGYHIIKSIKKEEYPPKKFEAVKEEIRQQLLQDEKNALYTKTLKEWKDKANIKVYDDNLK